ncbi:MAG: HD domain-containing protein [Treponema sp.]|jgi:HD superfamily phosphohydrolase|nr:HD domain-containing protein [Treponema sp.]
MKKTIADALTEGFTNPVRDVLWGHIYLTDELAELIESPPFMRLCRILQLGPVYLAYPGATHTRASHSIGVYHLGRRLLQNLAERGADQWLSPEGVKSFLAACLFHDLGHYPYTHSLKELPLASHESLTGAIILKEPVKTMVYNTGADPELAAAIVDKELKGSDTELFFYRKLLSGALDPDKLDYLNRDARYCGVPYGAQDVDFIFSRLIPHKERGADIDSRLIPNVESVLFSKYLMYRTVYWHRQVRAATAMIKKALISGLESGSITDGELYDLDDQSLFSLLREKTANPLAEAVRQGRIFTTAAEIPLMPEQFQTNIATLREIGFRSKLEEQLAAALRSYSIPFMGKEDLIIDLPEPVSFETGLYVVDEGSCFEYSSSAFKSEVVSSFIQTLYTVRVFINQKFRQNVKTMHGLLDLLYDSIIIVSRGN